MRVGRVEVFNNKIIAVIIKSTPAYNPSAETRTKIVGESLSFVSTLLGRTL